MDTGSGRAGQALMSAGGLFHADFLVWSAFWILPITTRQPVDWFQAVVKKLASPSRGMIRP
jgi:hypothetical protein